MLGRRKHTFANSMTWTSVWGPHFSNIEDWDPPPKRVNLCVGVPCDVVNKLWRRISTWRVDHPAVPREIAPGARSFNGGPSGSHREARSLRPIVLIGTAGWSSRDSLPRLPAICTATAFHHLIPHKKRPKTRPQSFSLSAKRYFLTAEKIISSPLPRQPRATLSVPNVAL